MSNYRDPWQLNSDTQRAEEETRKHERKLSKMTDKELVEHYGLGWIPEWALKKFIADHPDWDRWKREYQRR